MAGANRRKKQAAVRRRNNAQTEQKSGEDYKSVVSSNGKTIITLAMIVKNESRIIKRLLNSCLGIIHNVCVCDTGSTDGTQQIIKDFCQANNLPCKVPEIPFKNFGYNRTRSYQLARQHFPQSTYFILLDADMILKKRKSYKSSSLTGEHYLLEQVSDCSRYRNTRLIANRPGLDWSCVGVTHEYWSAKPNVNGVNYDDLYIDDREDGGAKADKFTRDNRLFKEELVKPTVPDDLRIRYYYYLGQTLKSVGRRLEAINYFRIRSEVPAHLSYEEEAWYATFQMGESYLIQGKHHEWQMEQLERLSGSDNILDLTSLSEGDRRLIQELIDVPEDNKINVSRVKDEIVTQRDLSQRYISQAMHNYLLSFNRRPWRLEPLYEAICYYREKGKNHVALMMCLMAHEIKYPQNDGLFVSYQLYEYKIDVEICINAFYIPNMKHVGRGAAKRMLQKVISGTVKDHAMAIHMVTQAKWYDTGKLKVKAKQYLDQLVISGKISNNHQKEQIAHIYS